MVEFNNVIPNVERLDEIHEKIRRDFHLEKQNLRGVKCVAQLGCKNGSNVVFEFQPKTVEFKMDRSALALKLYGMVPAYMKNCISTIQDYLMVKKPKVVTTYSTRKDNRNHHITSICCPCNNERECTGSGMMLSDICDHFEF